MVPGRALMLTAFLLLTGFFVFFRATPAMAAVPEGFEQKVVVQLGTPAKPVIPTALAFTPDGRMLVASKSGQLWVYKGGELLETPALDLSSTLCDNEGRGLLGVAVDPEFGTTGHNYVYLFHNYKKYGNCKLNTNDSPVNRVSRFVMDGDVIDPASQKVLIDNIPNPNAQHDGGDLKFGNDGELYVSVGDGSCNYQDSARCGGQNDAARDKNILLGKILRINPDGTIPADNPFTGASSAPCGVEIDGSYPNGRTAPGKVCRETFAFGFRNPFRMALDPDANEDKLYVDDVGQGAWEEIDDVKAGKDYGWNCLEGKHLNSVRSGLCKPLPKGLVDPIHEYNHNTTECQSVTGGAFVPDGISWQGVPDDAYLFGDYVCNKFFKITPRGDGTFERTVFASGLGAGGPISMTFAPYAGSQALYYTTFDGGGQVRRIAPLDGNAAPEADIAGNQLWSETLTINFDGSGSMDPDGNTPLTYLWDFDDDGTTDETTTSPTTSHTYASAGKYTAALTVRDSLNKSSEPTRIEVFPGDTPPDPTIESPTAGALFKVGEKIMLRGSATDAEEDGQLADSSLRWEVIRWHDNDHTHPVFNSEGNNLMFEAPAPEDLASTDPQANRLVIQLTATDSLGLTSEPEVLEIRPDTVDLHLGTLPDGLKLKVNGESVRAPRTLVSWVDWVLNVGAPRQHDRAGRTWVFKSWSDGGERAHEITTPDTDATYTATFRRVQR